MNIPVYMDLDMDYFVSPVRKQSVNNVRLYKDENCQIGQTSDFFQQLKSKIRIPQEKHIFTNHKKSYTYWWMKGIKDCTVVHVDAHSDLYRNKQSDLRLLNDLDMNCDDYLWYAIRDDFVNEIYWVCPEGVIDFKNQSLMKRIIGASMTKKISILNNSATIEFDVISRTTYDKTIKLHILSIKDLPDFGNSSVMLTMATSPEFIPASADFLIDDINTLIGFSDDNIVSVKKQHNKMLNITEEELEKAKLLLI